MLVWEGNALGVWNSLRLEMAAWSQCYSFRWSDSLLAWCRSLERRSARCGADLAGNTRLCFYERCINKICFFWTCKTIVALQLSYACTCICVFASARARARVRLENGYHNLFYNDKYDNLALECLQYAKCAIVIYWTVSPCCNISIWMGLPQSTMSSSVSASSCTFGHFCGCCLFQANPDCPTQPKFLTIWTTLVNPSRWPFLWRHFRPRKWTPWRSPAGWPTPATRKSDHHVKTCSAFIVHPHATRRWPSPSVLLPSTMRLNETWDFTTSLLETAGEKRSSVSNLTSMGTVSHNLLSLFVSLSVCLSVCLSVSLWLERTIYNFTADNAAERDKGCARSHSKTTLEKLSSTFNLTSVGPVSHNLCKPQSLSLPLSLSLPTHPTPCLYFSVCYYASVSLSVFCCHGLSDFNSFTGKNILKRKGAGGGGGD